MKQIPGKRLETASRARNPQATKLRNAAAIRKRQPAVDTARAQALYYAATGIWPLLHMRSFEAVTGSKADRWLVKTVGLLLTVIGASLARGAAQAKLSPDHVILGTGSAAALAGIDLVYGGSGQIRRVYLLDAIAQIAFLRAWIRAAAAWLPK
jgi:hypothetical protein